LQTLAARENVHSIVVPIQGETREDFTVVETVTGNEFRFVSQGPVLSEAEWRGCLERLAAFPGPLDFLAASGSLPPGVPDNFYAQVAAIAHERKVSLALDTSGAPLKAALGHGIGLLKPNLREMRELLGEALASPAACVEACKKLVEAGDAKRVALTLGSQGAIFVTREGAWRAWPLPVEAVSTVGAGDSFLGALICALATGLPEREAFRHAVAGGSAALLSHGTGLCQREKLFELLPHVTIDAVN
jgi:6-phosphofructokinase 2